MVSNGLGLDIFFIFDFFPNGMLCFHVTFLFCCIDYFGLAGFHLEKWVRGGGKVILMKKMGGGGGVKGKCAIACLLGGSGDMLSHKIFEFYTL